jgi:XTP/dITP diphosphohydrolase
MIQKLLIATNNEKKLNELKSLFGNLPIKITSLKEEGIDLKVEETGKTFEENAILKAEAYAKAANLPTLADDSGIEVDALNGRPGVYSARYAGENATDIQNCEKLLGELQGVPQEKRTARYRVVFAIAIPGQETKTCDGAMAGIITEQLQGEKGFGYDPIFFVPQFGLTAAEITQDQKNSISHRKVALEKALMLLI